jgi:hypothetical protein
MNAFEVFKRIGDVFEHQGGTVAQRAKKLDKDYIKAYTRLF